MNSDADVRQAAAAASDALAQLVAAMEAAKFPDTDQRAIEMYRRGLALMAHNPRGFPTWRTEVHR
jgi:hypothetical protein